MFTFLEIKNFLSIAEQNLLTDVVIYDEYKTLAQNIIVDKTGIDPSTKPDWSKMPFIFIMQHFIMNKISGLTSEYVDKTKNNFNTAMKILDEHKTTNFNSTPKTGLMEGLYDVNI